MFSSSGNPRAPTDRKPAGTPAPPAPPTVHASQVADPRGLLGRTFRIGDKCDALVLEVAFKLNGAVILECVWWSGVDRKHEYVHPQELGEEVVKAPFGFHRGGA